MTRSTSKGICSYCGNSYAKSAISRHLKSCQARKKDNDTPAERSSGVGDARTIFHLKVEAQRRPAYWIHIEIPAKATLKNLDRFLRDIWLECCGHLSSFDIMGKTFFSEVMEKGDRSLNFPLGKVIAPGMAFEYIYDFGTSTELLLTVVSAREGNMEVNEPKIMARNDPPEILCEICGKPATFVCSQCVYEGSGWLCEQCGKKHECGEDMFLPVVNSPRVGMCGYTGVYCD